MSFFQGLAAGVGGAAQNYAHSMLETQMQTHRAQSQMWQSLASDPGYEPGIRQQFAQNAMTLASANPFDKNSMSAAKDVQKLNPHDVIANYHQNRLQQGLQSNSAPYYNPETGYEDASGKLAYERQAKENEYNAQFDAWQKKMGLLTGQPPSQPSTPAAGQSSTTPPTAPPTSGGSALGLGQYGPPGSTLNKRMAQRAAARAMGMRVPEEMPKLQTLSYAEGDQPKMDSFFQDAGEFFDRNGEPRQFTGTVIPVTAMRMPTETRVSSSDSTHVDPLNATTTHQHSTKRLNAPVVPGAPSLVPGGGGGSNPVVPPAAGGGGQASVAPTDGSRPPQGIVKAAINAGTMHQVDQAWNGLRRSSELRAILSDPKAAGTYGPILGRVMQSANEIGSSAIQNFAARFGHQPSAIEAADAQDQAISAALMQAAGTDPTASNFASQIITRMRAMNASEVAMLGGGAGHGITRLYQMLAPALMNPTQDLSMIRSHMGAIDSIFADNIRSSYDNIYGSQPPYMTDEQKGLAQRLGITEQLMGHMYKPQPTTAPVPPPARNTRVVGQTGWTLPNGTPVVWGTKGWEDVH